MINPSINLFKQLPRPLKLLSEKSKPFRIWKSIFPTLNLSIKALRGGKLLQRV